MQRRLRGVLYAAVVYGALVREEYVMRVEHGFEPVYDENSRVLVLGTMPSIKSREQGFYYGHPQNRFWKVIAAAAASGSECASESEIVGGGAAAVSGEAFAGGSAGGYGNGDAVRTVKAVCVCGCDAENAAGADEFVCRYGMQSAGGGCAESVCVPQTIEEKRALLLRAGIAVWDVLTACEIEGSEDSSIRNPEPADIGMLLRAAPGIKKVICNGDKAYKLYMKFFAGADSMPFGLPAVKLPSTSPANAAWSLSRLIEAWGAELF